MVIIPLMDARNNKPAPPRGGDSGHRPLEVIPVAELLGRRDAVYLEHRGERYLLRITRNDKLILTK